MRELEPNSLTPFALGVDNSTASIVPVYFLLPHTISNVAAHAELNAGSIDALAWPSISGPARPDIFTSSFLKRWRGVYVVFVRLCDQGDDRNAVDERGYTPLHDAADKGHTRVVSRLLQDEEVGFLFDTFFLFEMRRKTIAFPSSRRTKTKVNSCTPTPSF